jgi:PAS domain S-box-containing protein
VSFSVLVTLVLAAVIAVVLLALGRRDYPNLHNVLDTCACLLAGMLALLLWDIGKRAQMPLTNWLARCFAVTFIAELLHVAVTLDWFGSLGVIAQAQLVLRPTTWPIAAYLLAVGTAVTLWMSHRNVRTKQHGELPLLLALLGLGGLLFVMFRTLPRYTEPTLLGITRPTLMLVPLLCAGIAWTCWRRRALDRIYPMLALMSALLVAGHLAMLYSRAPHDTQAMVAHIGKVAAFFSLALLLMQAATADMIERVRAENELAALNSVLERRVALRTAELQLAYDGTRAIIDTALDGVIVMSRDGVIQQFNPAAERIFGYRREAAVGRSLADVLVPEASRAAHRAGLEHYLSTGEARILGRRIEVDGMRADGKPVPLELSINRMPGTADAMVFAGFVRDLSPRKQGEKRLATQMAQLDLLNHISRAIGERQDLHSILQVTLRYLEEDLPIDFGCVCLYDAHAERLTVECVGVQSTALATGMLMSRGAHLPIDQNGLSRCVQGDLVYEPDIRQMPFAFPQRLARGGLGCLVVAPLQVESRVFGVLVAARKAVDAFSSPDCEFLRQLSEHVALAANQAETYAALQRAYDDLRQSQQVVMQQERLRALGQMASGIAHDINNAISPIALYADALLEREPGLSDSGRGYVQVIQRAIDDVVHTVARMREFYRQREPTLVLLPLSLNELVRQVVDHTRARWSDIPQQRGLVIEPQLDLAADLPPVVGVEAEVREALINLVFNAIDAMPYGGTLTMKTFLSEDGEICVTVNDTGGGMDEDTRRRCMEPFFTTKGERGTGLGLAMVYGIAQRHAAEVHIESAPGQGTAVQLKFPRRPVAGAAITAADDSVAVVPRMRMLLVDDDPLLLKSLRDILEADGHLVSIANGGQDGIDAFNAALQRHEPFAVVITDLGMPYVDGRSVARAIKELSRGTPVVLLTGWGQRLLQDGDIPANVDHVLSKPPKIRLLRGVLAQCCAAGAGAASGG